MDKRQNCKLRLRATKQKDKVKSHDVPAQISYHKLKPVFDIRCDHHKHCLEQFGAEVKANFASTIHKMGQMTWQQIETAGRRGLGYEPISVSQIKPGHPIKLSPDDKVKVFRLTDKERMAGVRLKDEVFIVLWIAPKHDLY